MPASELEVSLLFAHKIFGSAILGCWSMVALLSLWEQTGMERLQINETWNENQRIICVDKAGNAISKLYASQLTKIV